MYFKDIIGQEEVKERLRQSARTGIVPHAQLFTEQGGAGAFPLALAYARYLNCTNRTETRTLADVARHASNMTNWHIPICISYSRS